ncbi:MAG: hypothetical protein ACREYE_03595 [Gammaproteobacteria bacterium]
MVNLAGYFAVKGKKVTIADFDPQSSSLAGCKCAPQIGRLFKGLPLEGVTPSHPRRPSI